LRTNRPPGGLFGNGLDLRKSGVANNKSDHKMNTSVTPSAPGWHLPPDSKHRQFASPRPKAPENQTSTEAASDQVNISQPGLGHRNDSQDSEVSNAISFTQTQSGFLNLVGEALDRMGELTVLCQDTSKSDSERVNFTVEFTQLQNFISEIGAKRFNGVNLFSRKPLSIRVEEANLQLPIDPVDLTAPEPQGGVADAVRYSSADVNTHSAAATALVRIQSALQNLADMQGKVTSNLHRLNLSTEQMSVLTENLSAASGRINDIDLARSAAQTARNKILGQSGAVISTQANAAPQAAIRLLQ
jgi:flagellin